MACLNDEQAIFVNRWVKGRQSFFFFFNQSSWLTNGMHLTENEVWERTYTQKNRKNDLLGAERI